jgi:hypothetical protein
MANLSDETLLVALFRQGRLLKLLDEVTKADMTIYERFGETESTITALTQLQNSRERLTNSYTRVGTLLKRVHESQPQADASLLELFYRSVAQALATADAIEATVKETKRDWDLL